MALADDLAHAPWLWSVHPQTGLLSDAVGVVGAADGGGEDLFDQAGAGAAGRRRLGVLLDVVEGEQPLSLMALTMVPLHAVAATDLGTCRAWAALFWPWWPASPVWFCRTSVVAELGDALASFSSWKYQEPSAVSPYTPPTSGCPS